MSTRTPSYRLHKPTNQAVVTIDGRDFYLGSYDSPKSRAEYDRLIAEWLTNGRRLSQSASDGLSINELLVAYLDFAEGYYRKGDKPTRELNNIKDALRPFRKLYGMTPADRFGPLALKSVRSSMIDSGLCRNEVNKRVGKIIRFFRWAAENEHLPASVHQALKTVSGLKKGRTSVRESHPVKPVPESYVDAVRPFVARQVWAMIELQRLTGMRPGEVCQMRSSDLERSGKVWTYTPPSHKTEHHGKERPVYLGPRAQEVLRPWLRSTTDDYLFSPREASEERWAEIRRNRTSPITPSQLARGQKANPKRSPGEVYDPRSYYHAIRYGCVKAGVPNWHPNQLRHNAATWLRKEFGLEAARIILGHSSPTVTEIYAEVDREKAATLMGSVG